MQSWQAWLVGLVCGCSAACSSDGATGAITGVHEVDTTVVVADPSLCYPALDAVEACSKVDFFSPSLAAPLPSSLASVADGDYWFCPRVANCEEKSQQELVQLLCQYGSPRGLAHQSLRLVCGAQPTQWGGCCYGVDLNTVYD
jgi:hypothetical protein